jgi:hypothetical protein
MASEATPRNQKDNRMKNDTETQGADAIASKDLLCLTELNVAWPIIVGILLNALVVGIYLNLKISAL